jgi:hypothetical protein
MSSVVVSMLASLCPFTQAQALACWLSIELRALFHKAGLIAASHSVFKLV